MAPARQPLRVGLTGGIASGKSTVAGFLAGCGAYVIDADRLAHRTLEPDAPAYPRIVERFGDDILDDRRRIDRAALARRVFSNPAELQALNAIVHPLVRAEAERLFADCARSGLARIAVFEAALLVETGTYKEYDTLVLVSASRETQLARLLERGMPEADALARIESQATLEVKRYVADHIIENDGPIEECRRQTQSLYTRLMESGRSGSD